MSPHPAYTLAILPTHDQVGVLLASFETGEILCLQYSSQVVLVSSLKRATRVVFAQQGGTTNGPLRCGQHRDPLGLIYVFDVPAPLSGAWAVR